MGRYPMRTRYLICSFFILLIVAIGGFYLLKHLNSKVDLFLLALLGLSALGGYLGERFCQPEFFLWNPPPVKNREVAALFCRRANSHLQHILWPAMGFTLLSTILRFSIWLDIVIALLALVVAYSGIYRRLRQGNYLHR